MPSYKVEIQVLPNVWLPATHKYFKDKEKAKDFADRFDRQKINGLAPIRVKKIGGIDSNFFILGYTLCMAMYWFLMCACIVGAL